MSFIEEYQVDAMFNDGDVPTFDEHIKKFFKKNEGVICMKGVQDKQDGTVRAIDLQDYDAVKARAEKIYTEVHEGHMPLHRPSWSVRRCVLFRRWIDAGMPKI